MLAERMVTGVTSPHASGATLRARLSDEIKIMISRIWITLVITATALDVGLVWWVMRQV